MTNNYKSLTKTKDITKDIIEIATVPAPLHRSPLQKQASIFPPNSFMSISEHPSLIPGIPEGAQLRTTKIESWKLVENKL